MSNTVHCPVCGFSAGSPIVSPDEVARENELRDRWVRERVPYKAKGAELKDLTDFMHGVPAALLGCQSCGTVLRREEEALGASSYAADPNDPGVMQQVYPRYYRAFAKKASYRQMLRPHAEVVEVGSHLGAFLQTAEMWNWNPWGLDVGDDTVSFARKQGFTVKQASFEDARVRPRTLDAVFVWNCFEQLTDPVQLLRSAWRWLRSSGLLVLRVPNAAYYVSHRQQHEMSDALAYNNLLGFPYLHGYTPESLDKLVRRWGFEPVRAFNSELITSPFPDLPAELREEQCAVSSQVATASTEQSAQEQTLTGPWIEIVYRKSSQPAHHRLAEVVDLRFWQRAA